MYNIAFLGDERRLSFYRPLGFDIISPGSDREVRSILTRLQNENYSVVFVTEAVYTMAKDTIDEFSSGFLPAISVIPAYGEKAALGAAHLNELMENAVGIKQHRQDIT